MPIHDWARVPAGLFHHFHQRWAVAICDTLNAGRLPDGFYALLEQHSGALIPDVITLERPLPITDRLFPSGGLAVAERPPNTRFVSQSAEEDLYAAKADRIAVRHPLGDIVAIIEIVSPGNKNSRHAIRSFTEKALDLLSNGIHLLIIDLLPPSKRDPQGIHKVIWDEILEEPFELPADKRLTLAAYAAGERKKAYVEPVAVGDPLPDMPLFLDPSIYVPAPLEATYLSTWESCPQPFRELVSNPRQ